jgi:amidohydrolase
VNDPVISSTVARVVQLLFPHEHLESDCKTMVSEDMAFVMQKIPGCYFLVGSANPEKGLYFGHHHPKFDFDEEALPRAAALMAGVVLEMLS